MILERQKIQVVSRPKIISPRDFGAKRILSPKNSIIFNNPLINETSYVGPPLIMEAHGDKVNTNALTVGFARTPDIGDLIVFGITAGTTLADPTGVPSGFSQHTRKDSSGAGGSFMCACYYGIADGTTNSFTFTWASAGTVGIAGYVIRYHNTLNTAATHSLASSTTSINCGNGSMSFPINSLGIAFATTGNTSSGITIGSSYGNLLNVSSPVTPTRQAMMGAKSYLSATSESVTASWSTNRTAVSFLFYITSSNPT